MQLHLLLQIFTLLIVLQTHNTILFAQTIPANRLVDWSFAGVDIPFTLSQNWFNVLDYGALGNNTTNDAPAIQATIDAASAAGGGIVFLPVGTYLLQSSINIPSKVSLCGADAINTQLRFALSNSGSNCINVIGTVAGPYRTVISGYTKDATILTVADTSGLRPGNFAELVQDNNTSWDTQPISWAAESKGQMVRILARTGNTLTLAYPLRISYDAGLNVRIRPINPIRNVSIECLTIERTNDATGSGGGSNIYCTYCVNCRISGIHSNKSVGAHLFIFQCSDITINGCYIHDAFTYDGTSTRGYGVVLGTHSGQCLIVNNIFKHLRHAMSIKQGANGNVFAYNYAFDGYRSEFPNDFASDISLHGHYAYSNLFEGNHCELFWIDDAWGPSGPYNTAFRNRFSRHGIYMSSSGSNSQNLVGNEVTSNALLQGFYTLSGSDHFTFGNNIKGTINPAGTNTLPDMSYFFNGTPDFWNISAPFPPIGIPNTINTQTIPAKEHYLTGNYTVCPNNTTPLRVKIKVLLQGPYAGSSNMNASLRALNMLPIAQPFNTAPINYKGSEMLYDLSEIPTNAIDWILIELRQNSNPSIIIAQRAALLLADGTVSDFDGNGESVAFPQLATNSGNYYLSIKTRNHLPVLSANPVALPNTIPFNFNLPDNVAGNTNQLVQHSDNIYLIPAGDCWPNGVITYQDINQLITNLPATYPTYHTADCNMDGFINPADALLLINNVSRISPPSLH